MKGSTKRLTFLVKQWKIRLGKKNFFSILIDHLFSAYNIVLVQLWCIWKFKLQYLIEVNLEESISIKCLMVMSVMLYFYRTALSILYDVYTRLFSLWTWSVTESTLREYGHQETKLCAFQSSLFCYKAGFFRTDQAT